MSKKATGANYPAVSDRIVKNSTIPLPPISEQCRIAAILDQADALQAKRRAAIKGVDEMAQSIFVDMVSGLNSEPLGPKLSFITSGGRGWAKYYASGGAAFIRSLDVQMGRISSNGLAMVVPPDNAEARRTRTRSGDVLLTITGSRIGRASSLPASLAGCYISQHVAILRPRPEVLLPEYLSAFLCSSDFGQRQIAKAQYGQTKPGLNFDQIRSFSIPSANLSLQAEFVERATCARLLALRSEQARDELKSLFTTLQLSAFRTRL